LVPGSDGEVTDTSLGREIANSIGYPVLIKASAGGLKNDSVVLLNQIRSIDKQRLIRKIGGISTEERQQIDRAIQISLGLV
jgi:mRNA-degrading endonuclease toxin of MazEF toxin-antitoxin module